MKQLRAALLGALVGLLLRPTNGSADRSALPSSSRTPGDPGYDVSAGRTIDASATSDGGQPEYYQYSSATATLPGGEVVELRSEVVFVEADHAGRHTRATLPGGEDVELHSEVEFIEADHAGRHTRAIPSGVGATNGARSFDNNAVDAGHNEYLGIQPTKAASRNHVSVVSMTEKWVWSGSGSGEGARAPRGRQLPLSGPGAEGQNASSSDRAPSTPATARKTNPDIQDIITGIVKLLNGNPQAVPSSVQSSAGQGRPLRPSNTRINNRGPPRITDAGLPPPDTAPSQPDNLGMLPPPPPPRMPPPYPFEPHEENNPQVIPLPPQPTGATNPFASGGIPLPEQVVPLPAGSLYNSGPGPQHPGPQRPIIGPVNRPPEPRPPRPRPRPRPPQTQGPKRRPQPPPKKPLHTPAEGDIVFGNKKKDPPPQYITVGQYAEPGGGGDAMDDVTFTTLNPPPLESSTNETSANITRQTVKTSAAVTSLNDTATNVPKIIATMTSSAVTINEATIKEDDGKDTNVTGVKELDGKDTNVTGVKEDDGKDKNVTDVKEDDGKDTNLTDVKEDVRKDANVTGVKESVKEVVEEKEMVVVNVTRPTVSKVKSTRPVIGPGEVVAGTRPMIGLGEAQPVIESSMGQEETTNQQSSLPTKVLPLHEGKPQLNTGAYRPRPGIVLDDTEYKPLGVGRPIITAPPNKGHFGEVFDVTVSAIQGPSSGNTGKPYIYPVEIEGVKLPGGGQGEVSVITAAEEGQHFVSIDGKRTYINLFGDNADATEPPQLATRVQHVKPTTLGAGFVVPEVDSPAPPPATPHRPHTRRPPPQPPVRIDTCIVGDDTTCDVQQNEMCLTESGVSSCHCRPSYSRRKHREPCRRVVSIAMSLRVDKLYDKRVKWTQNFQIQDSEEYRQLRYEASRALDSAMSMTPFSDEFMGTKVINIYSGPGAGEDNRPGSVFVNVTLQLEENADTSRPAVRHDIQRHLLGVIHRRNNNIGDSALWVDSPPGAVSQLQDIDECSSAALHDCHKEAACTNVFGSYRCLCSAGSRDPWLGNAHRQGRHCELCPMEHCNNRGACNYDPSGQQSCTCSSGFYGAQCEIDGEVLGVAIGASVAAIIIIALTLVCLCMWSRRWSREQKSAAGMGSPVFGYMAAGGSTVKTPAMGAPPYQVSMEDRMRWAQIADVMAQANHYAPEPGNGPTRPSSAVFGYPNLGTLSHLSHMGTLQHGTMQHGTMQHGTMQHGTMQHGTMQHGTMQHGTMQHGSMGTMSHVGSTMGQHMKLPLPPIPLPRMNIPHNMQSLNRSQAAMSVHGGYSMHGGTFNPHQGARTPDTKKMFDSSSSDDEDRTDLLGRNFHVPRPKSRGSITNQSGIYYDVDQDQADLYASQHHSIPMSTYGVRSNNQYFLQ